MHTKALPTTVVLGIVSLLLVACTSTSPDSSSATPASSAAAAPSTGSAGSASTSSPTSTSTSSQAPSPATGPAEITPVLATADTEPVPVRGTDGKVYLAYELYLTNITSTPVTVDSVQAVDTASGAVLQTFSGADLVAHSRMVGVAPSDTPASSVDIGGGRLAIIWLDPSVPDGSPVPQSLTHQVKLTFDSQPSPLIPAELTETVATTKVSAVPAPTVRPPLDGVNWLDGNGCCSSVTPHRGASNPINGQYYFAERFAIDWVQLTSDLMLTTGDPTELSSYPYYGAPVRAVADGEIVAVSDELQDQVPGSNPPAGSLTLDQYGGNYVVQRFEQDGHAYYAFYAHLKPGTAKAAVSVGQTVRAGDQVGELGNSGNTDSPHLHFHVMDGPDPLASNGLPFQFDSMRLVGQATGDDAINELLTGQPLAMAPDGPTGDRTDEMPLYLDLVDLSEGPGTSTPPTTTDTWTTSQTWTTTSQTWTSTQTTTSSTSSTSTTATSTSSALQTPTGTPTTDDVPTTDEETSATG